ncbi:alpha/beta-hydrolase [Rickenella mellea]|uniref:Alpha/beta-hydrolase n=1 Tax=Rickenella mellea TaxID=50990 RepID=A0A4Y7PPT5_9AGAM|nr:alpha/beta-hydrolase [Rickenella mellea]
MSKVLAEAPGEHCVAGVKHSGEAKGDVEVIAGVETYVSKPPTGDGTKFKKIILFFADVYGPLYINNKLIQDYFASHGFLVVGIDYFEGSPVQDNASKPEFELSTWITGPRERAAILVPKWTEAVKEKYGLPDTKYSAVGYCFGGPFVMEHGAKDLISAGAIVHPAFLNEEHFHNMRVPLLLSCAETDSTFGLENRRRAEDILVEAKRTYHFQVFSGVTHGFAIRGNPEVENERWAKEESARGIITWFERFSV